MNSIGTLIKGWRRCWKRKLKVQILFSVKKMRQEYKQMLAAVGILLIKYFLGHNGHFSGLLAAAVHPDLYLDGIMLHKILRWAFFWGLAFYVCFEVHLSALAWNPVENAKVFYSIVQPAIRDLVVIWAFGPSLLLLLYFYYVLTSKNPFDKTFWLVDYFVKTNSKAWKICEQYCLDRCGLTLAQALWNSFEWMTAIVVIIFFNELYWDFKDWRRCWKRKLKVQILLSVKCCIKLIFC